LKHADHVYLLTGGVPSPGGVWADFGAGQGSFTLALADLIGPQGEIYAIDQDRGALRDLKRAMSSTFVQRRPSLHLLDADYTRPLELPPLDGIVMANALHFQHHKEPLVQLLKGYLQPGGRFILVEYNVDRGNPWVPYPISYPTWKAMAARTGFTHTELLAKVPSRFLKEIYSALSY
jgi:ubiquinone/menaquinone biosynthesis C-methylase UbiE